MRKTLAMHREKLAEAFYEDVLPFFSGICMLLFIIASVVMLSDDDVKSLYVIAPILAFVAFVSYRVYKGCK